MRKQVELALIGAGNRGRGIFGQYALDMAHRVKFVAVVEPNEKKRELFASLHEIPANRCFDSIPAFFAESTADLDGVVIATIEDLRLDVLEKAMNHKLHILIEKPLCTNKEDLIKLYDAAKEYDEILIVCHQMRLTPAYKQIKALVDSGDYGEIVCIQHSENLSWHHMAHSFVRGPFRKESLASMLLAKSCHDMDLLAHIIGKPSKKVSSFGSLKYFREENAPAEAPTFCMDECPNRQTCPYDVMKIYFEDDTDPAYIRHMGIFEEKKQLLEEMRRNDIGRCVFKCDNDVVDNQTVQIEFEDDVHVSFTMCGHNALERRMTKISMTNGEIDYDGITKEIRACTFEPRVDNMIKTFAKGTHGGGDRAIMDNFIDAIVTGDKSILLTPIKNSLEGHLLVFAAEEARHTDKVINMKEFEKATRDSL